MPVLGPRGPPGREGPARFAGPHHEGGWDAARRSDMFDRTVLLAVGLLIVILGGLQAGFGIRLPWWGPFIVYGACYALASAVVARPRTAADREDVRTWPTSGPIGRFGQRGLVLAFSVSGLLALLNPFQLVEIVRQAVGNIAIRRRTRGREPGPESVPGDQTFRLPFEGEWFVYNGGTTREESHSWEVLTQRYAYDFVVVDDELRRHTGRGTRPEDYHCLGLPVVAAADGVVEAVRDGIRTAPFLGWGVVDVLAPSFRGNWVMLRHGPELFSFYAHLHPGTVAVRPGERVSAGTLLGRCGHTGHSSEPHLHFHVQDRRDFFTGAGLPVRFVDLTVDGRRTDRAWVSLGSRVSPDR